MSFLDRLKTKYDAGRYIFRDGDIGTEMYILQAGKVDLLKEVHGKETVIATLEKGDFFGEMAVLENLPRNMSARVTEDAEIIAINGTTFDKMIKSNIEIAVRMLRKFSTRLREADAENVRLRELNRELEGMLQEAPAVPEAAAIQEAPAVRPPPVEAPRPAPPVPAVPVAPPPPSPPPPPPRRVPERPAMQLVLKGSSKTIPIQSDDITIGRADPVTGLRPDVDLTAEDLNRFISRRHAKILFKEGQYYLVEEVGVTNGTYLNGKRLQAGVYTPIQGGDELCFGKVFLTFEAP